MALTPINTNTPLAALRADGIDADFSRARLRVFPRHKVTNEKLAYIRTNIEAIVDELNLEAHSSKKTDPLGYEANTIRDSKLGSGCFLFELGTTTRYALGAQPVDFRDDITDAINGNLDH
jgi:hypothetical protein